MNTEFSTHLQFQNFPSAKEIEIFVVRLFFLLLGIWLLNIEFGHSSSMDEILRYACLTPVLIIGIFYTPYAAYLTGKLISADNRFSTEKTVGKLLLLTAMFSFSLIISALFIGDNYSVGYDKWYYSGFTDFLAYDLAEVLYDYEYGTEELLWGGIAGVSAGVGMLMMILYSIGRK